MLQELGRGLSRKHTCLVIMRARVWFPGPTGYGGIWYNPKTGEVESGRTQGPTGQSVLSTWWTPCQGKYLSHKENIAKQEEEKKQTSVDTVWGMTPKAVLWPLHMWTQTWVCEHMCAPVFHTDIPSPTSFNLPRIQQWIRETKPLALMEPVFLVIIHHGRDQCDSHKSWNASLEIHS